MNQLDRLIDEAAQGMVQHEPSAALTAVVMKRVVGRRDSRAQRGLVWGSVAAGVLGGLVLLAGLARTPARVETGRAGGIGIHVESSGPAMSSRPPGTVPQRETVANSAQIPRAAATEASAEEIQDPITFDPISPDLITIERVEIAVSSIEPVEIPPVEIEPISASND